MQVSVFTFFFFRSLHGSSLAAQFNCPDEGESERRVLRIPAKKLPLSRRAKRSSLCSALFKSASLFLPRLPSFDLLRQYPGASPRKLENSYQRADFSRDRKKMRVPALQEVGVWPRGCVYLDMCEWLWLRVFACGWVQKWTRVKVDSVVFLRARNVLFQRSRFSEIRTGKGRRKGAGHVITVPTFVTPLNTPSVCPRPRIYWISISASCHLHRARPAQKK